MTVGVSPIVSSSLGASTTILGGVREVYAVDALGGVSFVRSLDGPDDAIHAIITD
ncbi:MAG: hypothetical protein ACP5XB_20045 [Isosphaeraceae bacterium]